MKTPSTRWAVLSIAVVALGLGAFWVSRESGDGPTARGDPAGRPTGAAKPGAAKLPGSSKEPQRAEDADLPVALKGKVVDEHGPVAGAEVHVDGATLVAEPDGTFEVKVRKQWSVLWASHEGRASRSMGASSESIPEGGVVLRLAPAAAVHFTVFDQLTNKPIAGAEVKFVRPPLGRTGTTNAEGKVQFLGLTTQRYDIGVEVVAPGYLPQPEDLSALQPGTILERPVWLSPARAVSGQVVDERGAGLPGAKVVANRKDATEPLAEAVSDALGRFTLSALPAERLAVEARLEGYATTSASTMAPRQAMQLVLVSGGVIEGTVTDASGSPAEGLTVRLEDAERNLGPAQPLPRSKTGANGQYELTGVRPGAYKLVVRAAVAGSAAADSPRISLSSGQRERVDLRLPSAASTVGGRVTDAVSGQPIEEALVELASWREVHTDASGRFTFVNVGDGGLLRVSAAGYRSDERPVGARSPAIEVGLTRNANLTGRVVDEAGDPIQLFRLRTAADDSPFYDAAGRFAFDPPNAADELWVESEGFEPLLVAFPPTRAQTLDLGKLALKPAPLLEVTVFAPGKAQVPGARVYSSGQRSDHPLDTVRRGAATLRGTTDARGVSRFPLPSGRALVFAVVPEFAACLAERDDLEVKAGVNRLALHCAPGAWIRGQITENAAAVPSVSVKVQDDGAAALSDGDGRYRLGPLLEGSYSVGFLPEVTGSRTPQVVVREVTLAAGEEKQLNVELEFGAELEVEVTSAEAGPVMVVALPGHFGPEVIKQVKAPADAQARVLTLVKGRGVARFSGLPEGEVTVLADVVERPRTDPPATTWTTLSRGRGGRVHLTVPKPSTPDAQ